MHSHRLTLTLLLAFSLTAIHARGDLLGDILTAGKDLKKDAQKECLECIWDIAERWIDERECFMQEGLAYLAACRKLCFLSGDTKSADTLNNLAKRCTQLIDDEIASRKAKRP